MVRNVEKQKRDKDRRRRRRGKKEREVFQRSKKTVRSPRGRVEKREWEMTGSIKRWIEEMMEKWERMEEKKEEKMKKKMRLLME